MRTFKIRIWFGDRLGITEFIGHFKNKMECKQYYKERGVNVEPVEVG